MSYIEIVIKIPEEVKYKVYNYGLSLCPSDKEQLIHAIMNGTPIPDNATNGDVIKAMFPNGIKIDRSTDYAKRVTEDWLNSSYQR